MSRRQSGRPSSDDLAIGRREGDDATTDRPQEKGPSSQAQEPKDLLAALSDLSEVRPEKIKAAQTHVARGFTSSEIADAMLGLRAFLP